MTVHANGHGQTKISHQTSPQGISVDDSISKCISSNLPILELLYLYGRTKQRLN